MSLKILDLNISWFIITSIIFTELFRNYLSYMSKFNVFIHQFKWNMNKNIYFYFIICKIGNFHDNAL